jgi:FixJ family two-component response regulator
LNSVLRFGPARDRDVRVRQSELAELQERYAPLTPRELEILTVVVADLLNKQSALELGASDSTNK